MSALLSPWFDQQFFDNQGNPAVGYKLFVYLAGTTTKTNSWSDAGITLNSNPIILNYRGECNLLVDSTLTYKFVLATPTDTDPPTNPVRTIDNIPGWVSQAIFNSLYFLTDDHKRTDAEISAGVTPTNFAYLPGNVLRYGANATPGTTDMTTAFTNAIASNMYVYVPAGTYKITSNLLIPPYVIVEGAGLSNTSIVASSDVVAFVLQYWSQLRQLSVSKSGSHTKNLVEIGSASLDGGRAVLADILVTAAGNDNIQIINGNLGSLHNVTSTLATRDNVNWAAVSGDANNWTMDGFNDLRNAGRDNLHITAGALIGDPLCSKANVLTFTAQNAARYNVYVGTRSNIIRCYAEAAGTTDVFLDAFARGNDIETVNGAVVDSSANPSYNIVQNYNASGGYQRIFQNRTGFSGVAAAGWQLYSDDGTAGTMACFKSAIRSYKFQAGGSGATQTLTFEHENTPSFLLNLVVDGKLTLGSNTALSAKLDAYFNGSASNGVDLQDTNSTNGGTFTRFLIGAVGAGVAIGSITRNAATSAVLYNTTSDGTLKDITGPLLDAGAILDSIPVYNFTWKEGGASDRGVIAQELVNVVPQAVHVGTNGDPWGVDYSKLVPLLVAEVQALRKRVQALEG